MGNELGRNSPHGARRVARAAPIIHPIILSIIALVALLPLTRARIINLLANGGSSAMRADVDWIMRWMVLHIGIDGM